MDTAALRSFVRYIITGIGSVAVYVGSTSLLHSVLMLDAILANAASYLIATIMNYLLSYYWTFQSPREHKTAIVRYLLVVALGLILNSIFVAAMLKNTSFPIEIISLTFAAIWPLVSFVSLKMWALK